MMLLLASRLGRGPRPNHRCNTDQPPQAEERPNALDVLTVHQHFHSLSLSYDSIDDTATTRVAPPPHTNSDVPRRLEPSRLAVPTLPTRDSSFAPKLDVSVVTTTMIQSTRRWFRRNRTNFAIGAGVLGAGYLAGQYVLGKLGEARQRMSDDRIAKEKCGVT